MSWHIQCLCKIGVRFQQPTTSRHLSLPIMTVSRSASNLLETYSTHHIRHVHFVFDWTECSHDVVIHYTAFVNVAKRKSQTENNFNLKFVNPTV